MKKGKAFHETMHKLWFGTERLQNRGLRQRSPLSARCMETVEAFYEIMFKQ